MLLTNCKTGHSWLKNKEVMTVLVFFFEGEVGQGENRLQGGNSGEVIRVNHA